MHEVSAGARGRASQAQRAFATLLFSDVCDYTALSETLEPEHVHELKQQLEALADEIVQRHGGMISQVYGDGLLAVFGYPVPREDDARHAVEAALALHEAVRSALWLLDADTPLRSELRLHSGVHCGVVLVRPGDARHGRYDLAGDAVNTTARLSAAAGRDEIVASRALVRGIEPLFELSPAADLQLKGKRQVVGAHRVTGRSAVRSRFEVSSRRGLTDFVDRHVELSQLNAALQASLRESGRLLLVTGAPGIGKTRLLHEFGRCAALTGVRVLWGTCDSYGETEPLEPFLQIVREVFDLKPNLEADAARARIERQIEAWGSPATLSATTFMHLLSFEPWPASPSNPQLVTAAAIQAISALIETVLAASSCLLILDDWQWADDASRALLAVVCARTRAARGGIALGVRGSHALDPNLQPDCMFQLAPFSERDSRAVILSLHPEFMDLGVSLTLHQRSGGNALFLEELCRALRDDSLAEAGLRSASSVPSTVQGVIQVRVAALPPAQAELLRAASVIGIEFSQALLAEVSGEAQLDGALDFLCENDWIYATALPGSYRFTHGITRDVVYGTVLVGERRRMHRVIASALERCLVALDPAHAETLAYHHRGAGDYERAGHFAELAGDRALLASSLDRARFHYQAALSALDEQPQTPAIKRRWLAVNAKWSLPFVYYPNRDQLHMLERAQHYAIELGEVAGEAQTLHWRGWAHYTLGDYPLSIQYFRRAIELAEQAKSHRLVAQSWVGLGQTHGAAADYAAAEQCIERGLELKRQRLDTHRSSGSIAQGFAYALSCRALIQADRGDFDSAELAFIEALALVTGTGHAIEGSILGLVCMAQLWRGDWERAAQTAAQNRETAERVNSAYSFAMSSAFEGYARWKRTHAREAIVQMQRAIDWLDSHETGLFSSFNYGCLAEASYEAGDERAAREYADRALGRASQHDPLGEAQAQRVLAQLAQSDTQLARTHLEASFTAAARRGSRHDTARCHWLRAEWLTGVGDFTAAKQSADAARAEFEAMGMRYYLARAWPA